MRNMILVLAAAGLGSCGPSADEEAANQAAAQKAAAATARPPHCFFKDSETKSWAASTDAAGNVVVKGKAYRQDSRYEAVLGPPVVSGTSAEVRPTIAENHTGFAATGDWWDVAATIPNSDAVDAVVVKCGAKMLATLTVKRKH
jgi:hypothetical protein